MHILINKIYTTLLPCLISIISLSLLASAIMISSLPFLRSCMMIQYRVNPPIPAEALTNPNTKNGVP